MLWTVSNLWPSGARFVFNLYSHWSSLVFQNGNETARFMHSRAGMTQGEPVAMITYGIGIHSLIKNLKRGLPYVTHPWHAYDSGALGIFFKN